MVPVLIAKAMPLGPLAASQIKSKAASVRYFTGASVLETAVDAFELFEDGWFLPGDPMSVLTQIQNYKYSYTSHHLEVPKNVVISHKEHQALQEEIGAKGVVSMVEGLHIIVSHQEKSDLPQPVDMAPDLPGMGAIAPFSYTEIPGSVHLVGENPKPETVKAIAKLMTKATEEMFFVSPKQLGVITDIEVPAETSSETGAPFGGIPPFEGKWSGFDPGKDEPDAAIDMEPDPVDGIEDPDGFILTSPAHKPTKVYHKSGSDEHGTPQALFDTLNDEFHFDLDVCASDAYEEGGGWVETQGEGFKGGYYEPGMLVPSNAKCPIYFTPETDGLKMDWFGRVWMNPPYTKGQVKKWILTLIHELLAGHIEFACALVAARPDTQWFQAAATYAYEIRFLKGRLTFEGSKDPAPFPSALLLFDPKQTFQVIRFWDWKTKQAVKYYNHLGSKGVGLGTGPNYPGAVPTFLFQLLQKKNG